VNRSGDREPQRARGSAARPTGSATAAGAQVLVLEKAARAWSGGSGLTAGTVYGRRAGYAAVKYGKDSP